MGGAFAVAPGCPQIVQAYGCTSWAMEVPDPNCPDGHKHCGIDLADSGDGSCAGTPVYATRPGVVAYLGWQVALEGHDLGPNAVCLELDEGGWLWFGHLAQAMVNQGQRVEMGQQLGTIGSLGISTGPHLHLEYRTAYPAPVNAQQVADFSADPSPYLQEGYMALHPDLKAGLTRLATRAYFGHDPETGEEMANFMSQVGDQGEGFDVFLQRLGADGRSGYLVALEKRLATLEAAAPGSATVPDHTHQGGAVQR